MVTSTLIFFSLLSFFSHLLILTAQIHRCFNDKGYYTNTSIYHTNLNSLLFNLTSDATIDYGFYNSSYGQNPDRVYALGLCRGDTNPDSCRSCLNNATTLLPKQCPNQKEAFSYDELCTLQYSSRSMFGIYQNPDFSICMANPNNETDADTYDDALGVLFPSLTSKAIAGDSHRKMAVGCAKTQFGTIHGLVQCSPVLSEHDCKSCLGKAVSEIPNCLENKTGGRIIKLSCNIRYEHFAFYDSANVDPLQIPLPPPLASSTNPTSSQGTGVSPKDSSPLEGKSNRSRTVIIVVVFICAFIILLILIIYFAIRKWKKTIERAETEDDAEIKSIESLQYDFNTIKLATNNFSIVNKLGQGGFGSVYKGRLPDGQEVAVKKLSMDSRQGDLEFKNEVLLVDKLQHRNLVRLVGFCLERTERLLIYEFLPNKSLDHLLFDPKHHGHLNWELRYKIIRGIARGLLYLHEDSRLRIIHHDLKTSNILLDEELNPKISDFCMARLFAIDQTHGNTGRIVGTYGYMAPEYVRHGQMSVKSDVFSFGMLILEIVSGKRNNSISDGEDIQGLLSSAWKNWREGTALNIVDPVLNNDSRNEIMRCIHIGLLCVQEKVTDRPTMTSVSLMLNNSYSFSLPSPLRPPFLMNDSSSSEMHMKDYSSEEQGQLKEVVTLFKYQQMRPQLLNYTLARFWS